MTTQAQDRIAELEKALKPFQYYYDLNDCAERDLSSSIEVPVSDLRGAKIALESAALSPPVAEAGEGRDDTLRGLIREIDALVHGHFASSVAHGPVQNLLDHLSAIARCHEINAAAPVPTERRAALEEALNVCELHFVAEAAKGVSSTYSEYAAKVIASLRDDIRALKSTPSPVERQEDVVERAISEALGEIQEVTGASHLLEREWYASTCSDVQDILEKLVRVCSRSLLRTPQAETDEPETIICPECNGHGRLTL
jgi:hypothetical protein